MHAFSRESTLGRSGLSRSCELQHRFFWQNGMEVRLSLITALARWGFRFAGLHSRVNAWPFRFISLLRVNASFFWQNGMEVRLSLITASTTPRTLTMRHIIDNLRANDVPHCRQPTRQRKRQLHSVWTTTAPPHPQECAATTTAHRDSQGHALQTEPPTRQ